MNKWEKARYLAATRGGEVEDYLDHGGGNWNPYYKTKGKDGAQYVDDGEFFYFDKDGNHYGLVRKYVNQNDPNDKHFKQFHWDGNDFQYGAPKPKIPYCLPELIAATPETPVFICEGEKDADNVAELGLVATCSQGPWSPELNPWFKGKRTAYILEDNDEHGRDLARRVARALSGMVGEVRLVALPGLAEKGDVSDWIEAGGTKEELVEICAAAPVYVAPIIESAALDDFFAYLPTHSYIFTPTRDLWPSSSVNSQVAPVALTTANGAPILDDKGKQKYMPANAWLDKNKAVQQMTWAPGEPMVLRDRLIAEGGWFERSGAACFNLYRPPIVAVGNAHDVALWKDHIEKVYPTDADHIIKYCAHRVQFPQIKINHALFLGGEQGIGKDTIIEPVKHAVGPWNFKEVTPQDLTGQYNGFLKSVILRVSEARDLGEINRYQFYEHMKTVTASPPDVHRVNEKYLAAHYVLNCNGVIVTSNHKSDGIYLPADDRRNYIAWSDLTKDDFKQDYWNQLWRWYGNGGIANVAAYLRALDLSPFDPKAPPPKTEAFWAVVNSNVAPEESELADLIDDLGNPPAITIGGMLTDNPNRLQNGIATWLSERKNRRAIPHKMEACGYVPVRSDTKLGLWHVPNPVGSGNTRQAIYAKRELSVPEQHKAVRALIKAREVEREKANAEVARRAGKV